MHHRKIKFYAVLMMVLPEIDTLIDYIFLSNLTTYRSDIKNFTYRRMHKFL